MKIYLCTEKVGNDKSLNISFSFFNSHSCSGIWIIELSKSVADLVFEMLVILGTLHEAVSETCFFMSKELALVNTDHATVMALGHNMLGHFVLELALEFI